MRQPVLFLGHGSPMNAVADNAWTRSVKQAGQQLEKPDAIVAISAHWLTRGVKIHASPEPKTIHDFRGFPEELYKIQYKAPSNNVWAEKVQSLIPGSEITQDWGFDHGVWGTLMYLRPQADVPVIPVSLNVDYKSIDFIEMGRKLKPLRDQNVLIVASGNIVHNLSEIDFRNESAVFQWAQDFDNQVEKFVEDGDSQSLVGWPLRNTKEFMRAHPSSEHWAPFLVCMGAADDLASVKWIYREIQNGSISMRSALWS